MVAFLRNAPPPAQGSLPRRPRGATLGERVQIPDFRESGERPSVRARMERSLRLSFQRVCSTYAGDRGLQRKLPEIRRGSRRNPSKSPKIWSRGPRRGGTASRYSLERAPGLAFRRVPTRPSGNSDFAKRQEFEGFSGENL